MYDENMGKMSTIYQVVFFDWFEHGLMKSPTPEQYEDAKNSVRNRIDASFKADNIRLHVSPNRAILR